LQYQLEPGGNGSRSKRGPSTADVASSYRYQQPDLATVKQAGKTDAAINDEFVKFVLAAAIELVVTEPLQAAAAAAAGDSAMRRSVCLRHIRPHLLCAPKQLGAGSNCSRLTQVAFPNASSTAV